MSSRIVRRTTLGRVAVLEIDYAGRSTNVVDEHLLRELETRAREALADPLVEALVLASAKAAFGAGADVAWLPELAARKDAHEFLGWVHDLMTMLVESDKPIVAAVQGYAFGGALELALGSDAIVAAEKTRLGFPEVTLGLLPGGGGTQLITRFVPISVAAELLTSGRAVDASVAAELGLVREVVAIERLRTRAVGLAEELAAEVPLPGRLPGATGVEELARRRDELVGSKAGLSRASETILTVLEVGVCLGHGEGLAAERRGFLDLLGSPEASAAIHLFLLGTLASGRGADSAQLKAIAVVGGGQMGAGIAATAVSRGLRAAVRDINQESVDRAYGYLEKVLDRRGDSQDARKLWSGTTAWDGFLEADLVVEAVFEKPELKLDVLAALSEQVAEDTVLATNTSAISVEHLATAVRSPERFLGMHFFSPVERMPLVELIPHSGTSSETLARATAAVSRLGKVAVTVGDAPGFFTSRVYARWLLEGLRLVLEGVDPAIVDASAKTAGFPVGPLQAHDEATLELVLQASVGQVAHQLMEDRLNVDEVRNALEMLIADGAGGRRHGRGFYEYSAETGRRIGVNRDMMDVLGVARVAELQPGAVERRLLLAFVTECLLCWDEGVLCHPDDGDLAAVLGIGFPRVLGGPFHWVDETGSELVLAMCAELGPVTFPTGTRLPALARSAGRLSDEPRRAKPFDPNPMGCA